MPELSHAGPAAQRAWRLALIAYALPLTIGTHWPRLRLGTGSMPAPDKLIHLVAFGGLAFLLARSAWFGRDRFGGDWFGRDRFGRDRFGRDRFGRDRFGRDRFGKTRFVRAWFGKASLGRAWLLVALAWTLLDEITQSIPGLGRTTSWMDPVAGFMGIAVVAAWGWALAPVGGPANRARLSFHRFAHDELFARPSTWLLCGLAGVVGPALIGSAAWWGMGLRRPDDLFVSLLAGGGAALHFALHALAARRRRELARVRACPWCGAAGTDLSFDSEGCAPCSGCGRTLWIGQWASLSISRGRLLRLARQPALVAAAMAGAGAVCWVGAVLIHATWGVRIAPRVPWELVSSVDLAGAALAAATLVRVGRRQVAAAFDEQHRACMGCGHDVHGSPAIDGQGRCAECGHLYHVTPWPSASRHTHEP